MEQGTCARAALQGPAGPMVRRARGCSWRLRKCASSSQARGNRLPRPLSATPVITSPFPAHSLKSALHDTTILSSFYIKKKNTHVNTQTHKTHTNQNDIHQTNIRRHEIKSYEKHPVGGQRATRTAAAGPAFSSGQRYSWGAGQRGIGLGTRLDGLPAEKVSWEQSVQGGGTANHPAVLGAGGPPQAARVLGDATP